MASVNQICEELIRNVTNSDLEYKVNQTPYSLFFSIRKKFNKNSNFGAYFQNQVPSGLKEELLHIRHEYRNLFNFYQSEIDAKNQIESVVTTVKEEIVAKDDLIRILETELKKLKLDINVCEGKFERKCLEVKQLKSEVLSLNKDKTALGIANKSTKQEMKEQTKAFEKKVVAFEKKIADLDEFRIKKLNEEREEKIRKKKELKKEAKKLKDYEIVGKTKSNKVEEKFEAEVNEDTADTNSHAKASARKNADENENFKLETSDEKEIIAARESIEKHVPNVKVTNYFEILARDLIEKEPALNPNSNLVMVPTNSLVTTSHANPSSNLDPTYGSLILTTSLDTITSLVPIRSLDLTYSRNPTNRFNSDSRWKCETCEATIPWGLTFEQALHMEKHKKETKF